MNELKRKEVQVCLNLLSKAKNPSDAMLAWTTTLQGRYHDLSAMVALTEYNKEILPHSIKKYTAEPNSFLVSYFSSDKMYFLEDELVTGMYSSGEVQFPIDYSLTFDSNIASYVNKLVRGESLGNVHSKVVSLVDNLLHDDLNFDHLFYMTENIKNVLSQVERSQPSKIQFWRSLDKGFRRNLVSLQIFQSIDCQQYKRTSNPRPRYSFRQAARIAIEFAYDFYASEESKVGISEFVLAQRVILLQLIVMVKIQLSTSKGDRFKIGEYFNYIHNEIGLYFDREAIIAHKYFSDRRTFSMLEKIKKGCCKRGLLKKLDNIAWDMAVPRFLEQLALCGGKGRYFIPMFLTFDFGLRELLGHYQVKGLIFNKNSGAYFPIPEVNSEDYFTHHRCQNEISHYFSESIRSERLSREKLTRLMVHGLIRREYKILRAFV